MTRLSRIGLVGFGIACGVAFAAPWRSHEVQKTRPPVYFTHTIYGLPFSPWYEHAENRREEVLPDGGRHVDRSERGRIQWLSVSWVLLAGVVVGLHSLRRLVSTGSNRETRDEHRDQAGAPQADLREPR